MTKKAIEENVLDPTVTPLVNRGVKYYPLSSNPTDTGFPIGKHYRLLSHTCVLSQIIKSSTSPEDKSARARNRRFFGCYFCLGPHSAVLRVYSWLCIQGLLLAGFRVLWGPSWPRARQAYPLNRSESSHFLYSPRYQISSKGNSVSRQHIQNKGHRNTKLKLKTPKEVHTILDRRLGGAGGLIKRGN